MICFCDLFLCPGQSEGLVTGHLLVDQIFQIYKWKEFVICFDLKITWLMVIRGKISTIIQMTLLNTELNLEQWGD